jgi:hypothetical protein
MSWQLVTGRNLGLSWWRIDYSCARTLTLSFLQYDRATGAVHLYDISHVAAWREQPGRGNAAPCHMILSPGVVAPSESCIVFLNEGRHAVVSANHNLSFWDLSTRARQWNFNWGKRISSMVIVSEEIVVIGSSRGLLAFVNYKKLERASFSLTPTPTVVKEWLSHRGLETPNKDAMGIRDLVVDCVGPGGQLVRLCWVTFCGWQLSVTVDLADKGCESARIHHATALIKCKNASGAPVQPPRRSWSVPVDNKMQVTSSETAMFWENVPSVTQILPGHDRRVAGLGDESSRFVRSNMKPSLLYKFADHDSLSRIPLSNKRGPPTCLAVHPSHEWIVVGTQQDNFYAVNSRCKVV